MVKGTLDSFQTPLKRHDDENALPSGRRDARPPVAGTAGFCTGHSVTPANTARAGKTRKRTRIQVANEERILDAALETFATYGFRGATVDQIAEVAGMTKPNLLYYFRRKRDIYLAVLNRTHEMWLQPLEAMTYDGEPAREIADYIDRKLEMARDNPKESRLFAMEIIQGAPVLSDVLSGRLKSLVDEKAAIIRRWVAEGRLAPVDPYHLIFMVWATTQHYADFEVQIRSILGERAARPGHFGLAKATLEQVFLKGIAER